MILSLKCVQKKKIYIFQLKLTNSFEKTLQIQEENNKKHLKKKKNKEK